MRPRMKSLTPWCGYEKETTSALWYQTFLLKTTPFSAKSAIVPRSMANPSGNKAGVGGIHSIILRVIRQGRTLWSILQKTASFLKGRSDTIVQRSFPFHIRTMVSNSLFSVAFFIFPAHSSFFNDLCTMASDAPTSERSGAKRASERSAAERRSERTSGLFKNDAVFCKFGHSVGGESHPRSAMTRDWKRIHGEIFTCPVYY